MRSEYPFRSSRSNVLLVALSLALSAVSAEAQDEDGWPRELDASQHTIIMYQPQLETFEGNEVTVRAAMSATKDGETMPMFGVVWMSARVETDRDTRMVEVLDITVSNVRFPEATDEGQEALANLIEEEVPKWELTLSLDRLLAGLELVEKERTVSEDLNNAPPKIVFTTSPTVLVTIDGEPRMQAIENTNLTRVVNAPFTIILYPGTQTYYLYAGDDKWYSTRDLMGDWAVTIGVPDEVAVHAPVDSAVDVGEPEDGDVAEGPAPNIMVATEPTELIVSAGEPEYSALAGTDLLYLSNSESDVLLEIESQLYYVILSGRWYAAESMAGPFAYVPADELPGSFTNIPPESDMGHLLVWVPGTLEAKEAILDNEIPQTTAVDRNVTLEVTYDGEPKFEPIEDTEMLYAVNTSSSVIRVGDKYYACSEAIWFVADDPQGPWVVADMIPQEISTIPPSSPVYNVKYVYVYDSTPEVVYVGYTPGYTGSFVYGGTIVYGTGYYYPAWYGTVYYPRPATWGFHMRYNPWYGWSFGFSYSTGPFTFGIGFGGYHGGWWGPVGYRGYHRGYHRGWHHGYRAGYRAGARTGYRAGYRSANRQNNIYNRPQNRARNDQRARTANRQRANTAPNRSNNVYADRNGNVQRRNQDGSWQQRGQGGWQSSGGIDRTSGAAGRGGGSANRSSLDRSYQSRQRGSTRTNNYQRTRSSGARRGGRRD